LPGLPPVGPLICYEIIFPGRIVDRAHRPQWLLNLTNDGWFGTSSGPYQHFTTARLRAVEEGLPIVRAANTGISGLIDPYGRVLTQIDLGKSAVRDVPLPRASSRRRCSPASAIGRSGPAPDRRALAWLLARRQAQH
jgi:Apolipoprotein N-acyltransferase